MAEVADPVGLAERQWGLVFQRVTRDEYVSLAGCPFCGDGGKRIRSDRFHVFTDGSPRYWCRMCGARGFIDSLDVGAGPTPEQMVEARLHRLEQRQRENESRLARLEVMAHCSDHLRYHDALTELAREYWHNQGISDAAIDRYLLGFCPRCPTDRQGRPSYTIPIINRGRLENIKHRLVDASSDKYRPHTTGLGLSLFNADTLDGKPPRVIVVEGEKKTIVLDQNGFPAVGIAGKRSSRREWLPLFERIRRVYIALDPGAAESAHRLARLFSDRARVVHLPCKIDDMIVQYGATSDDVEAFVQLGRRVAVDAIPQSEPWRAGQA